LRRSIVVGVCAPVHNDCGYMFRSEVRARPDPGTPERRTQRFRRGPIVRRASQRTNAKTFVFWASCRAVLSYISLRRPESSPPFHSEPRGQRDQFGILQRLLRASAYKRRPTANRLPRSDPPSYMGQWRGCRKRILERAKASVPTEGIIATALDYVGRVKH
jgi:hypothetical protein